MWSAVGRCCRRLRDSLQHLSSPQRSWHRPDAIHAPLSGSKRNVPSLHYPNSFPCGSCCNVSHVLPAVVDRLHWLFTTPILHIHCASDCKSCGCVAWFRLLVWFAVFTKFTRSRSVLPIPRCASIAPLGQTQKSCA